MATDQPSVRPHPWRAYHRAPRARGRRSGERRRARSGSLALWSAFKRLTRLGFPRSFPIVQFPNLPLIVAFLAGEATRFEHGTPHAYAASVSYLAMTIWAYEELAHGVNWFRRLLGCAYVVILVMRVAHGLHP